MAAPKNQSVQKAFALLRSFRDPQEWVSNAELGRRAGLSEACSHRMMRTLEGVGAVVRNRGGLYRPGMILATLSKGIAIGDLIHATSDDLLASLAGRLKGVVHLGVLESGMVTYVAKFGELATVTIPSQVGAQQEAYCSALGKTLLAGLPDEKLEDFLYDGEFVALTPRTITTVGGLRSEILNVRTQGYAVDCAEAFPTICCIGTPIRDPGGNTMAAISFADTSDNLSRSWEDDVAGELLAVAEKISRRISPAQTGIAYDHPLKHRARLITA